MLMERLDQYGSKRVEQVCGCCIVAVVLRARDKGGRCDDAR